MASTNSCQSTSLCHQNSWYSMIPDATLTFKKMYISDSVIHLSPAPLHSHCFKGNVSDIFESILESSYLHSN